MFKILKFSLLIPVLVFTQAAYAQDIEFKSGNKQVSLIELYTSQGCSSCPPADEWLNTLKDKPGLWSEFVPVAFHVDYWDYLGWKDSFSDSKYSDRQRLHRRQGNVGVVYTPGFFLNGKEWKSRFGRAVPTAGETAGELNAVLSGNSLTVDYPSSGSLTLNIGVLGFGYQTPIKRGENSNRVLHEDFVLLSHTKHKSSDGKWTVTLPETVSPSAEKYGLAIWVNDESNLRPLQTTGGWLPSSLY